MTTTRAQVCDLSVELVGDGPLWASQDGTYAVWRARDSRGATTVLRGDIGDLACGEQVTVRGQWRRHARHGMGIEVDAFTRALPVSEDGLCRWLAARLDGVGPVSARALVAHFGVDGVFAALDAGAEAIGDIALPGARPIPPARAQKIVASWHEVRHVHQTEAFLFSHGVTPGLAGRLYRRFGERVIALLRADPYRIATMPGIGFRTADRLAGALGIQGADHRRLEAALVSCLSDARAEGDCYVEQGVLISRAQSLLLLPDTGALDDALERAGASGVLACEDDRVYLPQVHAMEVALARMVRARAGHRRAGDACGLPGAGGIDPTPEQQRAVDAAMRCSLSLVTGGAGVGKSTVQRLVCQAAEARGERIALCAPTGKAARRLAEVTGREALTLHRLLEFRPEQGGFARDGAHPVEADLVVVDEASMLTLELADALMRALAPATRLVLVGDPDQLPPVGAGRVLGDLIDSGQLERTHLTQIFRQAHRSGIVRAAHRVRTGEAPEDAPDGSLRDFFIVERRDARAQGDAAIELASSRIPSAFGLCARTEVMTLAPMRAGDAGLERLNQGLQDVLNRDGARVGRARLRVGDRVIQNRNDYTPGRMTMNGEIGWIEDRSASVVRIRMDDRRLVEIPVRDLGSFSLAWAISVHKAQGSQFPAICAVLGLGHWVMLSRALAYTAITRAERACVLVSEPRAVGRVLAREGQGTRRSHLAARISDPGESGELI